MHINTLRTCALRKGFEGAEGLFSFRDHGLVSPGSGQSYRVAASELYLSLKMTLTTQAKGLIMAHTLKSVRVPGLWNDGLYVPPFHVGTGTASTLS